MSDYYFDEEEILELLKEDDWPVFDDLFNNFATQDSSPPADEILPANEDSSPLADDEILPAHEVLDAPATIPFKFGTPLFSCILSLFGTSVSSPCF